MTGDLRAALRWALYGLVLHGVIVAVFLLGYDGNPQWFVHFGEEGSVLPVAREVFGDDLLIPHEDGHDGQAYWLIARDPLLLDGEEVVGPNLDRPGYRAQRILYPALAAPWRLLGEDALLWGLIATNLASVFVGGLLAAMIARHVGAPLRASLAFAFSPGVIVATIMDGSDALALAGLLGAVLAILRGRYALAVLAAVAATLAKEPMLLGLGGLAVLAPRIPVRVRLALVAAPAVVAAGWAVYARWRLGWPPSGVQEFSLSPFWGYVDAWRRGWKPVGNWHDFVVAVALVPLAVAVLLRWWRRGNALLSAAVPFVAMVPFLSAQVLDLMVNALRAVGPAVTFLWLDAYSRGLAATPSTDRPLVGALLANRRCG